MPLFHVLPQAKETPSRSYCMRREVDTEVLCFNSELVFQYDVKVTFAYHTEGSATEANVKWAWKYRKASLLTSELAAVVSSASEVHFERRMELVQQLPDLLKEGKEVHINDLVKGNECIWHCLFLTQIITCLLNNYINLLVECANRQPNNAFLYIRSPITTKQKTD